MLTRLLCTFLVRAIALYQRLLSPDHSWLRLFFPHGVCRFSPTCSQYAKQAIMQHQLTGVRLAAARIIRCHPWSAGGFDSVPTSL